MRVSRQSGVVDFTERRIFNGIEKIRQALGKSHAEWADELRLDKRQYARLQAGKGEFPSSSLIILAAKLNFSIETFIAGKLDYTALAAHNSGDRTYIPEAYRIGAFSRVRSLINVLQYAGLQRGWQCRQAILKKFQITEAALEDPEAFVNFRFTTDVLLHLRGIGFDDDDFLAMGKHSLVANRNSLLEHELLKFTRPRDVYEHVFEQLISFHEKNSIYRIQKLNDDFCVVDSVSNPDVCDLLHTKHLGSQDGCMYRAGVMASTQGYIGRSDATVEEISCVHRGDPVCRFVIFYGSTARIGTA